MLNLKTLNLTVLLVAVLVLTPTVQIVLAQSASTFWISSGIYPHGCSYTIWREDSYYYAKNEYGRTVYSGTNPTTIFNSVQSSEGLIWVKRGEYVFPSTVTLLANVTFEGEGSGEDGTVFKAHSSFVGTSLFQTNPASNELITNINFRKLRIDGNSKNIIGLNLTNLSCGYFYELAIVDCDTCMHIGYYGSIPPTGAQKAGGAYILQCRFRSNTNGTHLNMEYNTQNWIEACWFVSGANVSIRLFDCDKIHGSSNEINTVYYGVLVIDDGNPDSANINFDNNWIVPNATSGYAVYIDLTNPSPYRKIKFTDTHIVEGSTSNIYVDANLLPIFKGSTISNRKFEQAGIVQAPNGATEVTILHLIVDQPTSIIVTPTWNASGCYITSANTTHFVVDWGINPPSDQSIYWYAEYQP